MMNVQRYINGTLVEQQNLGNYELTSPLITSAVKAVNDRISVNDEYNGNWAENNRTEKQ